MDVAVHECRGHFWHVLSNAIQQAGGSRHLMDDLIEAPFYEVVDLLAQNGLRMIYLPQFHVAEILEKPANSPDQGPSGA